MDVLVEVTPGAGWLARENDRLVWLPHAESLDVAHDVIEPLLVADSIEDAVGVLVEWTRSSRQLPAILLLGLTPPMVAVAHRIGSFDTVSVDGTDEVVAVRSGAARVVELTDVRSVVVDDPGAEASGMFVEGVIRAGGFRVHLNTPALNEGGVRSTAISTFAVPADDTSDLAVEVAGDRIPVGGGLVLGRWPYSHRAYDDSLETVILADPSVSRLHAEIRMHDGVPTLIDRQSHNGTWRIDDSGVKHRLTPHEGQPIAAGERIRTGDTELAVVEVLGGDT